MAPIKVYILMGQSNMLGEGRVKGGEGSLEEAVFEQKLYQYLRLDSKSASCPADPKDDRKWATSTRVRNVRVMCSGTQAMKVCCNKFLTPDGLKSIGPELGIGHELEAASAQNDRIMLLKSCIGNRSLGWDLLPPGSESFEYKEKDGSTWVYPGYKGSPERWQKGTDPEPGNWYAGMQYDGDVRDAKAVLSKISEYYPGETEYEIAGFFWWQGDKDSRKDALADRYEQNLVHLIRTLRKEFNAPKADFVCATLGQTEAGAEDNGGKLLDAMFAVDAARTTDEPKYKEFVNNVATVYTHPLSKGGSSGSHYNKNAQTYMNVGEAMGKAMVELHRSHP